METQPGIPTSSRSGASAESGRHLLIYDGDCRFCHTWVLALARRDRRGRFDFAARGGAVSAARGIPPLAADDRDGDAGSVLVLPRYRESAGGARELLERSQALRFVLRELGGWGRPAAALLGLVPRRWLDAVYDAVARRRHRWFGGPVAAACPLPDPAVRDRFLDLPPR